MKWVIWEAPQTNNNYKHFYVIFNGYVNNLITNSFKKFEILVIIYQMCSIPYLNIFHFIYLILISVVSKEIPN